MVNKAVRRWCLSSGRMGQSSMQQWRQSGSADPTLGEVTARRAMFLACAVGLLTGLGCGRRSSSAEKPESEANFASEAPPSDDGSPTNARQQAAAESGTNGAADTTREPAVADGASDASSAVTRTTPPGAKTGPARPKARPQEEDQTKAGKSSRHGLTGHDGGPKEATSVTPMALGSVELPAECVVSFPATWRKVRTWPKARGVVAPNCKLVALRYAEGIQLWDLATGRQVRTLGRYRVTGESLSFSPDGEFLASGAPDTLKLWHVATGREMWTLTQKGSRFGAASFSPDGKLLACSGKLWHVATGKEIGTLAQKGSRSGHLTTRKERWLPAEEEQEESGGGVGAVSFSHDGKLLAAWHREAGNPRIRLWDVTRQRPVRIMETHSLRIQAVRFSPDGKFLASCGLDHSVDNNVRLWDVTTGKEVWALKVYGRHEHRSVEFLRFSPDGKLLAAVDSRHTAKLLGTESGRIVRTLGGGGDHDPTASFSPDGKLLTLGEHVWDVVTGRKLNPFPHLTLCGFSPDGTQLISTCGLWEICWDRALRTLTECQHPVFSPNGRLLASRSIDGKVVRLWDVITGMEIQTWVGEAGKELDRLTFSPNGKLLAALVGANDFHNRKIRLWDTNTGVEERTWEGRTNVSFSPDGKLIAFGRYHSVELCDAATGKEIRTLTEHDDYVRAVSFSWDGRHVVSEDHESTVIAKDVAAGKRVRTWGHPRFVTLNGKLTAIGIWLLDEATGNKQAAWRGVVRSPNENCQVLVCPVNYGNGSNPPADLFGARIDLRDWTTGQGQAVQTLMGHVGWIGSFSSSPDGRSLASGGEGRTIRLWDVTTGKEVRQWCGHHGSINSLSFSPDGRLLASGSVDGTIKVWPLADRPMNVAIHIGIPFSESRQSAGCAASFAEFYADVSRIARVASREDLAGFVQDNPGYSLLLVKEMLRESVYHHPANRQRKLDLAESLAELCSKIHGHDSLAQLVRRTRAFTPEQIQSARGLTFLAATRLFTSGDEATIGKLVRAAPDYAGLFVAECVIRAWSGDVCPLPADAPPPLKKHDDPDIEPIDLARRVAVAFEECYGNDWLMAAAKMGEGPLLKGDPDYLRAGVDVVVRAAQRTTAFAHADMQGLRRFVKVSLGKGHYEVALARACSNQMIADAFGDERTRQTARLDVAEVYTRIGDYGRALESVGQAEAIAEETKDPGMRAAVLVTKACVQQSAGRLGQAPVLLRSALGLAVRADRKEVECRCRKLLALSHLANGAHADARAEATKALRLAEELKLAEDKITSLYALGCCHAATGDYTESIDYCRRAIAAEEGAGIVGWKWQSLMKMGECEEWLAAREGEASYKGPQRQARAWEYYVQALEVIERQRGSLAKGAHQAFFSEDKASLYEAMVRCCIERKRFTDAVLFAERCKGSAFFNRFSPKSLIRRRALLRSRKQDIAEAMAAAKAGQAVEQGIRDLAAQSFSRWPRSRAGKLMILRQLMKKCDGALEALHEADWARVKNPFDLAVTTIKRKSKVLEFFLGKDLACAFMLGRHTPRVVELAATSDEIAKLIDDFRTVAVDALDGDKLKSNAYREPLAKLYEILIKPFGADLAEAEMVYIVPHGVLHYLPFQALIDDDGKHLIEKVEVAYVPSLNVLRHCRGVNMGNKGSLLAVANPDTEWEKLPATEQEAAAVSGLFRDKAEVVMGAAATEKVVKEKAGKFDVLTFPTHGEMVWEDPTKSNLRFTPGDGEDGKWTVEEIFDMDLKANLVVLSACETGLAGGYAGKLPEADDFVGLTRAFMYAGVPSVVGSLWKVADDSAVTLMTQFFTNWKQKGMDKAEALRETQLAMIRGDVELGMVVRGPGGVATVDAKKVEAETGSSLGRHPYFWAPFVLIGDYK